MISAEKSRYPPRIILWRLGREEEAVTLFERILWLNPTDNPGIRFLLPQIRAGERWEDHE